MFCKSVQMALRNPVWIIFSIFQPLCFLLLFAPLLEKIAGVSGFGANALVAFVPGLIVMTALYGTSFVGFGFIDEMRLGVIERLCVTPVNRTAIFLGRSLSSVVFLSIQVSFMLVLAYFFGLRAPIGGVLLSYIFVALIGFSCATASNCLAYVLKNEDALAPVTNFFLVPIYLLAGVMLPMTMAPNWLQNIAFFNPLTHAVNAVRALFLGQYTSLTVWAGYGVMLVAAVLAFIIAARLFKQGEE